MSADPLLLPERVPLTTRLAQRQGAKAPMADQWRTAQTPAPTADERLRDAGFVPHPKIARGGAFVSVTKQTVGLSVAVMAAMDHPVRLHVWVRTTPPAMAIVPASSTDRTAYACGGSRGMARTLNSDKLHGRIMALGFGPGRYPVRVDGGIVFVDLTEPIT